MKNFTAEKSGKLSQYLLEKYNGALSYARFMKLLREKDIKINGARVRSDVVLNQGDFIEVYYDGDVRPAVILFNESGVLVADKPCGVECVDYEKFIKEKYPSAELANRLDRNTRGLIVFSLDEAAKKELFNGFKNRYFEKYYIAEVYGRFEKKSAVLTAQLKKIPDKSTVIVSDTEKEGFKKIITEYKVIKENENSSVLLIKLITGRTHQIRAHMAHIGHFVIGDGKYGDNKINRLCGTKTQKLASYKIVFHFPENSPLSDIDGKTVVLPEKPFV